MSREETSILLFLNLRETPVPGIPVVDNSVIGDRSVGMIQGIQVLFRQYDYHRALRAPAPAAPANPPAALVAPAATTHPRPFERHIPPNKYNPRVFNFSNVNYASSDGGDGDGDDNGDGDEGNQSIA
ncbi:hypothetical protein BGX27_009129 [Mortierella sp. AM989]|nr:hypothetical protein BGX27_009129 [Mortierella sp. AM989]